MDKREEAAYLQASRPIRELDYMTEEEEVSLGRVVHLAGMRAVEDLWEREWGHCAARATQLTQRQHQVQGQQQDWPHQQHISKNSKNAPGAPGTSVSFIKLY